MRFLLVPTTYMIPKYVLPAVVVLLASCGPNAERLAPPSGAFVPDNAPVTLTRAPRRRSIWSVVSSPNEPPNSAGVYDDVLYSVSGTSNDNVWAVGNVCCSAALIEHWTGTAWSILPAASNAPQDTTLRGVAALSPTDAWAVGGARYPENQPVFEHWHGRKWKAVASPYIANGGTMYSVVGLAKNNVWAAGVGNFAAVLEHWDGRAWSFVPAYDQGVAVLNSIAASGPNDIWAVGEFLDPNVGVFTEHYDGTQWSYEQPANNFYYSEFNGVAVLSPTNAWTVGLEMPNRQSQVPQTLIEHWDGYKWSVVRSPNRNPKSYHLNNSLYSVAAKSPNDIWAVGFWTTPNAGPIQALFLHWDGEAWRFAKGPPPLESKQSNFYSFLNGVTRLPSGTLWSVGDESLPSTCCEETLTVEAVSK